VDTRQGVTGDFAFFYARHVDMVYRLCFTYLRNAADCEDAVQNIFIKLLAKPRDFTSEEHERAWLVRVSANHCKDVLKSSWNKRTSFENVPEPVAPDEKHDDTLELVMALPETQRICVYLCYYEGYNAAEVAQMLDKPHSTVRNHLSEARAALRKVLEDDV
jgi:RNA polymerase sigma-70 factor (ECF subfamily)